MKFPYVILCCVAFACACGQPEVSPKAPARPAIAPMEFAPLVILEKDSARSRLPKPRGREEWLERARSRGHCFELVARAGVVACVTHRHKGANGTTAGELILGDRTVIRSFSGPYYMSLSQPGPSPKYDVTLMPSVSYHYRRYARGWRAREEARRRGLVDPTDYSTGEFFTDGPERRYDQGEAPMFMRRPDGAALRCGDDLHRFAPISFERAAALFGSEDRGLGTLTGGIVVAPDAPPAEARTSNEFDDDPCVLLFGLPTPAQKRHTRAQYEDWSASLEVEKLPDIRWCLDREGSEAGEDIEAMWRLEERMSARVARDAAELARRLHAIRPDIAPFGSFRVLNRSVAYPASSLKGIYKWWSRLGYEDRPEAVRLEVMTRLFGTTPTHLRLENHTTLGERFKVEFDWCHARARPRHL